MYADEKIVCKQINADLKCVFTWLCANRLSVNIDKIEFMIFKPPKMTTVDRVTSKFNGITIHESPKVTYLGLVLDDRLSWKLHIIQGGATG